MARWALFLALCLLAPWFIVSAADAHGTRPDLRVSLLPDRTGSVPLQGFSSVDRSLYVFVPGIGTGVSRVEFHLDEPRDSTPRHTEMAAPYDFAGGSTTNTAHANPWDPTVGSHVIRAYVGWSDGHWTSDSDTFTITAAPFEVGVTDRGWVANDKDAQAKLGYKRVRAAHTDLADDVVNYKAQGMKAIAHTAASSSWATLRDDWLKYGPNGTVTPGVVDRLEVGNEESYPYKNSDRFTAGRDHALAVRSLRVAVPNAKIICQGDEGAGGDAWFRGMAAANGALQVAADCDEYSIHPYGLGGPARMDTSRAHINMILGDPSAQFAVTEWGVSVRLDQGCVDQNYGFELCMTHAQAAQHAKDFVAYAKGRGDVRLVTIFQNTDQTTNDPDDQRNFGVLSSTQTGQQEKGAYTTEVRNLIAANPFAE